MLGRLLALAILAIVAYYLLTEGLPWLKTAMDGGRPAAGGDDPSSACISEAARAGDDLAAELIPNARPPVDQEIWGTVVVRAAGALARAESACACPTAACGKATEAIWELRAMFDELDDVARGNPMGIGNPARRQERFYELLGEARAMAAGD